MGQAKRRGTYEERKANPLGDTPKFKYWSDERLSLLKEKLVESMKNDIEVMKGSLFSSSKKKSKQRRIKTGG